MKPMASQPGARGPTYGLYQAPAALPHGSVRDWWLIPSPPPIGRLHLLPRMNQIADDLGETLQLMNLTITIRLVVQGIITAVLGDLADHIGRRPVYVSVLGVYLAVNLGLALQRSYLTLLVLGMLQNHGSSSGLLCACRKDT